VKSRQKREFTFLSQNSQTHAFICNITFISLISRYRQDMQTSLYNDHNTAMLENNTLS